MRVVSLFAGIGGFDLGFSRAGMEIGAHVEIDQHCRKLLAAKWPQAVALEDIRNVHSKEYLDRLVRTWFIPLSVNYSQEEEVMAGQLKKLTKEQAEECVRMYEIGLSLGPIAKYFNVSRQAMWDLLRRRTKLRPQKMEGEDNHFHRGGKHADDHAQNLCEVAIRNGVLIPKPCEVCGNKGKFKDGRRSVQAHHSDYNKPLAVTWLCQRCHYAWHKSNKPVEREVLQELPSADVLCGGFP